MRLRVEPDHFTGWVNHQQQDVIDYLREESLCSEPGFGASVSGSLTTTGAGSRQDPDSGPRGPAPDCLCCHIRYASPTRSTRNHQGLGNRLLDDFPKDADGSSVECRERLGGLLRYDYRAAA